MTDTSTTPSSIRTGNTDASERFDERVDVDVLRYSRVWEDERLLIEGLSPGPDDDALSIASAGENVFALLATDVRSVTALDVSPAQLAVVDLHRAAIDRLDAARHAVLVGHRTPGSETRAELYSRVERDLDPASRRWFEQHPRAIEDGLANGGRLERYFAAFQHRSEALMTAVVRDRVLSLGEAAIAAGEGRALAAELAANDAFTSWFRDWFGRQQMERHGRDAEQMRHVVADVGETFLGRFLEHIACVPGRDNPYLSRFVTGSDGPGAESLTLCDPARRSRLRERLDRLRIVQSDLGEALTDTAASTWSIVNCSDLFEYLSDTASQSLFTLLADRIRPGGRVAWWNLLVHREPAGPSAGRLAPSPAAAGLPADRMWFYGSFHVRVLAPAAHGAGSDRGEPRVPGKGDHSEAARKERLAWAASFTGADLSAIDERPLDGPSLVGNLENHVGAVSVPIGLAGPLLFDGNTVSGWRVAPMATTEGALVASTSRGATALSRAGGVRTCVIGQRMMRVPYFEFDDAVAARRFTEWLPLHREALSAVIREVSAHAQLVDLTTVQVGRQVHVSFVYETADAAGQNMTTATTWHALQWLEAPLAAAGLVPRHVQIEATYSGDKRVSFANLLGGRGTRVVAEAVIPADVIRHVLKVEPSRLLAGYHATVSSGVMAGEVGHTANAANAVAAIFLATGQDVACVHESSLGFLTIEADGDDIYASMTLPSLAIGSIGGGTHLRDQQACLALAHCDGPGGSERLAELIAGFALGLDLSLTAALTTNQFASAHERLGRNRPVAFLRRDELDGARLVEIANQLGAPDGARIVSASFHPETLGPGIITELGTRMRRRKHVGIDVAELVDEHGRAFPALVKAKALDGEVLTALGALAALLGPDLALSWRVNEAHLGFIGLHTRELGLAQFAHPALDAVRPRLFGTWDDPVREIAVLVTEFVTDVRLRDRADDAGAWTGDDIDVALRGIAGVHAAFLDDADRFAAADWFGPIPTVDDHVGAAAMYRDVVAHAAIEYPDWFGPERCGRWARLIETHGASRRRAERRPHTLVHHDFNSRNAALRRPTAEHPDERLVAWDWELATVDIAHRDVAEFLAFALTPGATASQVEQHIDVHRRAMEAGLGRPLDPDDVAQDYRDGLHTFAATRLLQYVMAHEAREFLFLGRVIDTTSRLCELAGLFDEAIDVREGSADAGRAAEHR